MSSPTETTPPPAHRPRSSVLSGVFWPIVLFAAVMLYIQRPAVTDLYARLSGNQLPESTIPWRDDFQSALTEVRGGEKPMLLVFSASWCGPCNAMKRSVWSDRKVGDAVAAGFVPMHIDVDDPEHAEVTNRYGVRSIPAIYVLDADGEILARQSYMSRSETLAFLASARKP